MTDKNSFRLFYFLGNYAITIWLNILLKPDLYLPPKIVQDKLSKLLLGRIVIVSFFLPSYVVTVL